MKHAVSIALSTLISALAFGCAARDAPAKEPAAPVVEPAPAPPSPALANAPAEPSPSTNPPPPADPPEPTNPPQQTAVPTGTRAALGAPCTPGSDAQRTVDPCGTKRRVSIEIDERSVRLAHDVECKLEGLRRESMRAPSACVHGDRLYAVNACIACRLPMAGWSARAVIGEMTDAQAMEVQKQLALPVDGALKTPEQWKKAIAAAREKP